MSTRKLFISLTAYLFLFLGLSFGQTSPKDSFTCILRYSPHRWQTCITLPDDSRKVMVDEQGKLLYEFPLGQGKGKNAGAIQGFTVSVSFGMEGKAEWKGQNLYKPEVPVVNTKRESEGLIIRQDAFTVAPLLFGSADTTLKDFLGTGGARKIFNHPGNDLLITTVENTTQETREFTPVVYINSVYPVEIDTCKGQVLISDFLRVTVPYSIAEFTNKQAGGKYYSVLLKLKTLEIFPGEKVQLAVGVAQGHMAIDCPNNIEQALALKKQAIHYWENLNLPYNQLVVPDTAIQNLLNATIRNIYQSREYINGQLAFQSGSSVNRELRMADASSIIEVLTFLNQTEDVKKGFDYLFNFQKADGSFHLVKNNWKENSSVLWAVSNYARLTGDKSWLEKNWPRVEKTMAFLIDQRNSTLKNAKALNYGLMPAGFVEGIKTPEVPEYASVFAAFGGMNSATNLARWFGRQGQAIKWQYQYNQMYTSYQEALKRDTRTDKKNTSYLPVLMGKNINVPAFKGQSAFLNAVYPGKIFDLNDPLMLGNFKILQSTGNEGLISGIGWLDKGISNPIASSYAHALLWTGKGQDAASVLYAIANHATPVFSWCEEQNLKSANDSIIGDIPQNGSGAEFFRLARHLIVLERNYELHLLEGFPAAWAKPGMETKLEGIATEFGDLNFKLKIGDDGQTATIDMGLTSVNRKPPLRILVHLDGLTGNPASFELEQKPVIHKVISLN